MIDTFPCRVTSSAMAASLLRHLDAAGLITADHSLDDGTTLFVTLTADEIEVLRAHGVDVDVGDPLRVRRDRDDVGTVTGTAGPGRERRGDERESGAVDADGVDFTTGFVTGYLDATEVTAHMQALAAAYPQWCSLLTLPHQTSGYDGSLVAATGPATVRALRITADPTVRSRPGFLLIGGTHAREWMNPLIALEFAEQLLSNVDPSSSEPAVVDTTRIVTEGDVIIVPVLNPDGLNFSIHDAAGWRKNRRPDPTAGACPGVDDNRNFEVYFGGPGSSASPCAGTYRGTAALSEAETRNVAWLLDEFPNILVGVDSHSFGQVLFRPQPTGGAFIPSLPVSAADHAIYTSLETTFVNAVATVNSTVYGTGSTSNHAGTSDEYLFFAHRVFGFDTECGTSFQPAWPDAAAVIAEVAAGLRALAVATLDLTTTTPVPLAVVQCIDRTGSMVTFGYDGPARANARRFVDLLSLGDSVGIVTFADPSSDPTATPPQDRSQVELPLTVLDDPGDAASARAAVDGITFGGWTSIGAGLARSADLLGGAAPPRAVLLLSDGYENREPTVASVLATWPAGLRVFTVALGTNADAALLEQVATHTGGVFQASPTVLDLHQVYNQMRADMTDAGLILNEVVGADDLDRTDSFPTDCSRAFDVEPCADRLVISVSHLGGRSASVRVLAPSGREVIPGDFGVRFTVGDGYINVVVDRPAPGRWEVDRLGDRRHPAVVAAFVESPLRTEIRLAPTGCRHREWQIEAAASWEGQPLAPVAARVVSHDLAWTPLPQDPRGERHSHIPVADWTDRPLPRPVPTAIHRPPTRWTAGMATLSPGLARVQTTLTGQLPGGAPFRRVALRTAHVGHRA